eukprot:CAMPEP_0202079668 /NCGR_PEP_ID=MMETSP0964-20121228/6616_1 /ASSEMBLY_ACC=CAM_ASM_000500 /TAXON_ID=4773 /ORGANISM="Schizochytrium aggregatum, Strain ATCC28209" /LENGTH=87 /DNA_ID=CAMNT_0048647017 /DNA_START=48 /DNA_END=311 /DNA_ORIENTATION=+
MAPDAAVTMTLCQNIHYILKALALGYKKVFHKESLAGGPANGQARGGQVEQVEDLLVVDLAKGGHDAKRGSWVLLASMLYSIEDVSH